MAIHDDELPGKSYDAALMRRLLGYLWPYAPYAAGALLAILVHAGLRLVQPYLVKIAIDRHIATGELTGLDQVVLLFLAALLGSFAAEYLETYLLQLTGQRIMFDLRSEIYRHLQRLDVAFYDRTPVGRLMTRVTSDVDALNDLFTSGVVSVFGDVFTLLGIMGILLSMDWRLALVTFSVLPLIVWVTQWFRRNVRESYRTVRALVARINAFLQEHITGMATVQLFRRETHNLARFDRLNTEHRDANIASIFFYAVFYPSIEVIGTVATALILCWGGGWVLAGSLSLGALVAFTQYAQRFFRPISDLSEKFNLLQSAMASSERIFGLLDTPVSVLTPQSPRSSTGPGRIEFDGVWFAYAGEDYVLRDVSFTVEPGQRLAIVGATGAGKSTIINLLMRFYDVSRGRILLDGVDIRDLALDDLRRRFGLVLQDVHLFSGTVAGNIRLGTATIGDDRVRHALRAVHADRFVDRLPGGLDTPVVERGATLSTGQKQLLSFARALAFDPQVLVLDEATSSVDTETEILIRDALRVLMRSRTTVAIAHRLSTIQDMDTILVLHKGQVREAGGHQDLLARRGLYYRLYQLQYQDQEDERPAGPSDLPAVGLATS